MHKSATKCNETVGKWCKNKHGASKIIDTLETYQEPSKVVRAKIVCREPSEIEWQSVFKNCAEVVRLFNFQGKLFQLQFAVEMVTEKNGRDGNVQNKDMGSDAFEDANGGKSDDGKMVLILTCLKILVMETFQILVATRLGINTLRGVVALRGPRGFCMRLIF
jgi:hypothetical protein